MTIKTFFSHLLLLLVCQSCANTPKHHPWQEMERVLARIVPPRFPGQSWNVRDFGAGEGQDITRAIAAAIAACHAAGGGSVIIPAGEYVTGAITLKSNVNLHLSEGTLLKFSTNPKDYTPFVLSRWEGIDCYNYSPLIYARGAENVAVTGKGVLDGQADNARWWPWKGSREHGWQPGMSSQHFRPGSPAGRERLARMNEERVPVEQRVMDEEDCLRPPFIQFLDCKNVLIEGITITRAPFWLIHPLLCENVTIREVRLESHGPNNDGCDPESCQDVLIERCYFNNGDDCIAIKSGRDNDGRTWNVASENIIVRDNVMRNGHGGVVIGSEVSGNCRNVWVENCEMNSANLDRVIRIKSNAVRGGVIENIFVRDIRVGECKEAIFRVEMKYEKVVDGPYLPVVRNIHLENISCRKSRYGLFIDGFADRNQVYDVFVKNCTFEGIQDRTPNRITGAGNVAFDRVFINGQKIESANITNHERL
ncbi:MAG: glycoside hydrolase family 28 protein [Odoribacteraceae bacterium]|jgi:polygalacturonase|nr:glycoside hydrolase family 28 protein [Odoribacteraceae bacterium]